ncbi:MAG: hypothetical protein MK106_08055 [Mariniblastus sp.]|nr:hypothetical protein [Mariniblastus sp.]
MRVSERLQHGFWTWALIGAAALIGLQVQAMGQTGSPADNSNSFVPNKTTEDTGGSLDKNGPAKMALLKARQALAHGDVTTAEMMVKSASQYKVDFSALGDSPDAVNSMIAYQRALADLAAAKDRTFNSKAASFLLTQANSMVEYQDLETANMLVAQAKKFPVDFATLKLSPETVTERIMAKSRTMELGRSQLANMKTQAMKLMSQAELAFDRGDYGQASKLTMRAKSFGVADADFGNNQMRPWQMELKLQNAMKNGSNVVPASFDDPEDNVVQADYDPAADNTRNIRVGMNGKPQDEAANVQEGVAVIQDATTLIEEEVAIAQDEAILAESVDTTPVPSRGMQLYRSGLQALESQDRDGAREYFELAWQYRDNLDTSTQQSIQDKLASMATTAEIQENGGTLDLDAVANAQAAMYRKMQSEVFRERAAAERALEATPRIALERMTDIRNRVSQSELDAASKRPLLTIIDRDITEMQTFIESNLPEIMNDEANASRLMDVELGRQKRYDTEVQIQKLVEDFNNLLDEGRYAEAEQIARQAADLDPDSEISSLLREKAKLGTSIAEMNRIKDAKERGVYFGLRNAEEDAIPFDEKMPLLYGDTDEYAKRVNMRAEELSLRQYSSESERQIWNLLKDQKVQGEYRGTLFEAVDQLSTQAGVNIIFDGVALAAEGIETNREVDVPIREPISLQSALNVILGSAGLVFIVEDEVIKVTSKDAQRRDVKPKTYYVGDLVTPVKNFNSSMNMNFMTPGSGSGMNGYMGQNGFSGNQAPLAMGQNGASAAVSPIAMAQQANAAQQTAMGQQIPNGPFGGALGFGNGNRYGGGGVQTGQPQFNSFGPPSLGGITQADFEPLIDLIKTTIDPEGWDDTNGDGTIQSFVPNLSLIVSQTQEVQDEIQDLLEKLRELNDVQIVVEVRFITLRDNFFERIGIDFDFRINDVTDVPNPIPDQLSQSAVVGREPVPERFQPTQDLDVAFLQNSFASAVPQFGGFDVGTAANFGFAILSDIEVFFLIQASKGDTRSNIMQAPTVTMFNGQSASVSDGATRPFVTSVIPVVGDFAVAQQPVITLLPDGTSMNVQAVVSNDRKSVRMTLVPFFSQVQDVQTFTFDGSTKTRRETNSLLDDLLDPVDGVEETTEEESELVEVETSGVTIQLPTVGFTTINTVVSVPDGGTVLMGGIKRMSEGRTERGVPFLSNVPYINRLFKNVGIGRETSNIMMMVTPRIIIQEEEETRQVGQIGGN